MFQAHPKYSFDYSVKDPHTGDDKEHWETRDGDKVKGKTVYDFRVSGSIPDCHTCANLSKMVLSECHLTGLALIAQGIVY